ncbi:MAG TPA: hypothetical protein VHQ90_18360 [Thermoanaerobaculia bacterium]|nr:hypothetical protein [Thermoanaerobaculia bacterium]
MSRFPLFTRLAIIALVLTLAIPWPLPASQATRGFSHAKTADSAPELPGRLWDWLRGVWSKIGCTVDPSGACVARTEIGCTVDPNGCTVKETSAASTAGRAAIPLGHSDIGCTVDPDGCGH